MPGKEGGGAGCHTLCWLLSTPTSHRLDDGHGIFLLSNSHTILADYYFSKSLSSSSFGGIELKLDQYISVSSNENGQL